MLTAAQLKRLLQARGLRLTKRRGQHHLIDPGTIQRVVAACEPLDQATVIEIGPGLGALTEPLAARASRVVAVEIDRGVAAALAERAGRLANVEVRCGDILRFPWAGVPDALVVGAIPYHITSPILVSLFDARHLIARAVLVIQEEVAQRLAARPGTKSYGRLSVLVQYGWEVELKLPVPRAAFFPRPSVESRCVELRRRTQPAVRVSNERLFFEIVKAGFAQRRKTLLNALAALPQAKPLGRAGLAALLDAAGLPATARAETLPLEAFARLTALLEKVSGPSRCVTIISD
jgi:16S rRNA (adenine1518-N6/adenine1519-N6)-dimethyltransferase